MMTCEQQDVESEAALFRLATFADEPAYLLFNLNGVEINPIVERLDKGEASFVSTAHFDSFYEGQMIGPAVLSLQDEGMAVVYPVVKSKNWPMVDVQFMEISSEDREMITRFLATSCSGRRPPTNRRPQSIATLP
jgi:hypothetical protein